MSRAIYEVYAKVVDANGTYNTLSGYPKVFDSIHYNDDTDKTLKRAQSEYYTTLGTLYSRDDRLVQLAILFSADGTILESRSLGANDFFSDEPNT